ncbi:hypothetical protein WKI65_43585 [Streptomyces sp. MS1.AVA.3]|uniref:hypothetical protein n=1 Tax=Streptomyces decoyicus TaxID=249567 RepID=UPI0030C2973A
MHGAHTADALIRKHQLSGGMLTAIRSGANGVILSCTPITEKALIRRGIMHPVESTLTALGQQILDALNAARSSIEPAAPAEAEAHAPNPADNAVPDTAKGRLPKYVDDSDARAAIEALDNLTLAELTDHFEPGEDHNVRGFMVEPRGNSRVAVYWVSGGSIRKNNGDPFKAELQIAADKLRAAGWRIEPKTMFCVFAWRPMAETMEDVAVQLEAEAVARLPKIKAGDLIEAETVSTMPRTVYVHVDREPWQNEGHFGTVLCDPKGAVVVKTDSIRIVDVTPAAPTPTSEDLVQNAAASNDPLNRADSGRDERPTPSPERLRDTVSYAIQWRKDGGKWHGIVTTSALHDQDEVDAYVADVQALAAPGVEVRAVEIRLTHTALPMPGEAKQAVDDHGPVDARTLRSGCRVDLYGAERLVWKLEYLHAGNCLRIHTVPPVGEHPGYFTFTKSPGEQVELLSRGPAVDVTGRTVDDTR